ncbi:formate dehydrogenase subunit delta [Orrella marina]|uniref:Formate dehydrogenase n=1 Tax=Orrella marina TaxID=2163011 RepID=A0A2R4XMA4_9BURK|nr:formate dehydrogenase subunit delta [Orrella marina]AWB34932.1 formate dehydrogenase [Orrella marina]
MNIGQLVRMANQIGAFFVTMPDQDKALEGIAEHLRKFWEPRMRRELLAFLDQHPDGRSGDVVLDPVVCKAVDSHRIALTPMKPAPSATTAASSDQ